MTATDGATALCERFVADMVQTVFNCPPVLTTRPEQLFGKGHEALVTSVAFSPDGKRLRSQDISGSTIDWDLASEQPLEKLGDERDFLNTNQRSPDGRWLGVPSLNNVLLVDLEFKNTPVEKAIRKFKARPDPIWHRQQLQDAIRTKNLFAELFHRAWLLKIQPADAGLKRELSEAYDRYLTSNEIGEEHLPTVAAEVLGLTPKPVVSVPSPEADLKDQEQ